LATALIDTGSRAMPSSRTPGSLAIHLDRKLADRRVFPAIDVESGLLHGSLRGPRRTLSQASAGPENAGQAKGLPRQKSPT
jgi:transcription termination factor Rho